MAVFFTYSHDGEPVGVDDLEYAPSLEVVRRQLASRVRTGLGHAAFTTTMNALTSAAFDAALTPEEWPPATDRARMYVWRRRAADGAPAIGDAPDEVWKYSGSDKKPHAVRRP